MLPNSASAQLDEAPPLRVLRLREVKRRTGLSQSGIYAKMARGEFPRSIPLGALAVGWLDHEIDAWIAACKAKRDAKSPARPNEIEARA
jgi:prophage regulatory protein